MKVIPRFKHSATGLLCLVLVSSAIGQGTTAPTANDLPRGGMNVFWGSFSYFTSAAPFTNALKNSGPWRHDPTFSVDEHGYPTSLSEGETAERFVFFHSDHYPTGDYTLRWEGTGALTLSVCGVEHSFTADDANTQTIPVPQVCPEGGIILTITATQEGDHLRNIRLFLPGYDDHSSYWTDHYIAYHARFAVSRFAWGSGMYSPQSQWSQRSELADISWSDESEDSLINNGVPYEAMIDLANRARSDLWVCSPPRADEAYQRNLATLIRDHLDPDLRVWIEWGNEYWNCGVWGYEGCVYLQELETQNGLDRPYNYAPEALDLFSDFETVFSATGEADRVVTVLGGQADNAWELEESTATIHGLGRMDEVDVFAIGPYFHGGEEVNTAYDSGGMDAVFATLQQHVQDMFNNVGESGQEIRKNLDVARLYNKPMVAYEGGQHITSWVGVRPELVPQINRDPRMHALYLDYFNTWESIDVTATFVNYADITPYNQEEAFGLKEYYDQPLDETHKLRAYLTWLNSAVPVGALRFGSVDGASHLIWPEGSVLLRSSDLSNWQTVETPESSMPVDAGNDAFYRLQEP